MHVKKSSLYIFLISIISNGIFMTSILPSNAETIYYLVYCCALVAVSLFIKKDALAPSNLFLYFYMIFLGFGLVILRIQYYPLNPIQLSLVTMGLTCFLYGNLLCEKSFIKFRSISIARITLPKINYNKMEFYSMIIFCIAVVAGIVYLGSNIGSMFENFEDSRITAQSGNGVKIYFMYLMIPSLIMMYYCHLRNRKISFLWLYVILSAFIFIFVGSRSRLMEIIVGFLLVRNDYKRIKPQNIISLGIACIGLVSMLAVIRNYISGMSVTVFEKILNTLYVNNINLSYVLKTFPDVVEFQYGSTYGMNFLLLLPGSQQDFTLWLKETIGISFSGGGVTPSIIGECYLNFGITGVYFIMFILGMLFSKIDKAMNSGNNNLPLIILTLYLCKSITGGLTNIEIILVWFEVVTLFVCFACGKKTVTPDIR